MSRVWIEDRSDQAEYQASMEKWKVAKKAGSKRQPPARWRLRWYDASGKPKALSFQKLPDAEKKLAEVTSALSDGSYRDPQEGKKLFSDVAEAWHTSLRKTGERTLGDYRELLDNYIVPQWGSWRISAVRWEDVDTWVTELTQKPGVRGRLLAPATVKRIYRITHSLFEYAVKTGKIPSNPAAGHELPQSPDEEPVFLDYRQTDALIAAAGEWGLLVEVLAYTGIRWGEASALTAGRVLVGERRLWIAKAYTKVKGKGLVLKDPKNHERRRVPLLPSLATDLGVSVKGLKPDELVFTVDGEPIKYRKFQYEFSKAVKRAELDGLGLTPHKLRHTAASMAIASGANVKIIQNMLGHKDATMTLNLYGHLWPDDLDEVASRMDAARRRSRLKAV
jgi:integrase